jgi:hypothetical protein
MIQVIAHQENEQYKKENPERKYDKQDFLELVGTCMGDHELHYFFSQIENDGKKRNYANEIKKRKQFYNEIARAIDPNNAANPPNVNTPKILYCGIVDAIMIVSLNQTFDLTKTFTPDQVFTMIGRAKTIDDILAAASALENRKIPEDLKLAFSDPKHQDLSKWFYRPDLVDPSFQRNVLKKYLPSTFDEARKDFLEFEESFIAKEIAVLERKNNIKVVYSFDDFRYGFLASDPTDIGEFCKNRGLTSELAKIEEPISLYLQVFKEARRIFYSSDNQ